MCCVTNGTAFPFPFPFVSYRAEPLHGGRDIVGQSASQAGTAERRPADAGLHPASDGGGPTSLDGILVPFQFDLGGPVDFDQELIDGLKDIGAYEFTPVRTRSFNVSYLSRNSPIVRISLSSLSLTIVGIDWKVSRWLMLYPWLGTVSLNYYFEPEQAASSTQLLQFYDALIKLIDEDYLPYLDEHGRMSLALQLKTGYDSQNVSPSRLHMGATIDRLRSVIKPSIKQPRPTVYYFMNFRILYFWDSEPDKEIDHHLLAALLDLRDLPSWRPTDEQPDLMTEIGQIWSNGWVTVSILHPSDLRDKEMQPIDVLQAAFGLCHAQWFLCQIWISTYMEMVTNRNWQHWSRATVERYADHLYSLERDLTEVVNLDVMLRDPLLISVSQFFLERLGVSRHLEDAKTRVSLLTQYLRGRLEIHTSRAASRLQVLFSFSAAAAIAGLVQPIWPLWPVKTVVWVIALLSLTLFFAFSFRWASVRRVLLGVESNARKGAVAVQGELADQLALITRLRRPSSSTGAPAGTRSTIE
jgi:hypothetical protein